MQTKNIAQQKGFTMVEIMMTIAVLAILVSIALPAIEGYTEKRRIIGAAEEIYSQLHYARSESIKQSANMFVKTTLTGVSPSTTWDLGVSSTTGCDPVAGGAADCLVSGAEKVTRSTNFPGVSMATPTFTATEAGFEPVRGTVNAGSISLTTTDYALNINVSVLGRISISSPDSSVAGY